MEFRAHHCPSPNFRSPRHHMVFSFLLGKSGQAGDIHYTTSPCPGAFIIPAGGIHYTGIALAPFGPGAFIIPAVYLPRVVPFGPVAMITPAGCIHYTGMVPAPEHP